MTEREIQAELDKMDGGLFLDKSWDSRHQTVVYSVKHFSDPVNDPFVAVEWRDLEGRPLGLNQSLFGMNILQKLRQQEGSIKEAYNAAIVGNAVRKEKLREQALLEADEVTKEWDAHKRGRKSISIGTGSIDHKTSLNKRDV